MSEQVVKFCPRCRCASDLASPVCAGCGRPFTTRFPEGYAPAPPVGPAPLKWFQEPVAVVLLLVFFWPVGLYCAWNTPAWSRNVKAIVTLLVVAPMILFCWCWVAGLGLVAGAMTATTPPAASAPTAVYGQPDTSRAYIPGR